MAKHALDLGVSTGDSIRRRNAAQQNRIGKSQKRCRRIGRAAKVDKKSRNLITAGARPQMEFGASCCGTAPKQINAMRRNIILGLNNMGYKPCSATMVAWNLGMTADPWIKVPMRQVQSYLRIWKDASDGVKRRMDKEWQMANDLTKSGQLMWNDVIGPVWATVAYLHMAGWNTNNARRWMSAKGKAYVLCELNCCLTAMLSDEWQDCVGQGEHAYEWQGSSERHSVLPRGAKCLQLALSKRYAE